MKKDEKGNPLTFWGGLAEIKQETIEEAAENYSSYDEHKMDFIAGAKWQQERMYSEGDMNHYANYRLLIKKALNPKEWFEQFNKKL